ncbi:Uncharacterized protein AXF42_Ash017081 [Apostasia shenzhenica]|uniref:Uncharacterized protein n=1 Tax=Apostasia shenzhenica TaxID=1088818 RepID=A0A2H9ZV45_9ASPA|nr:Uncharacterized protein AXF42_Ash017081 [Apostasia shenzhenica]
MDRSADIFPSSPTNSSPSSSDLDTESTGSFFPDRSTSLGTLMGLTFPELSSRPGRAPSICQPSADRRGDRDAPKPKVRRRRRKRGAGGWWRLCREDIEATSLEEFLRAERRISAAEGHFLYGGQAAAAAADIDEHEAVGGGRLFENGRVLPPQEVSAERRRQRAGETAVGSLGRLPELIAGICNAGEG